MIRKAVILAAGRGTRMGDYTLDTPKAMLPVRGRPMLEHVLDGLASVGIEQFLVVTGYRREMVEEYFGKWRLPIEFRVQETLDGTGSATRLAREFAANDPFLLTFADILCPPAAYTLCANTLTDHPATLAVMGVKDVDDPWQGAAVYEQQGVITRVVEKPPQGTSTTRWNSAGLYSMSPLVFPYLDRLQKSPRGEYELTDIFTMMLNEGREVRISAIEGAWRDVGRPEDLAAAESL